MRNIKLGFTLIELLVVISIIGILAALGILSYTGIQKQARDAKRMSDIKQYQTLLGEYASKNKGLYPEFPNTIQVCTVLFYSTALGLTTCFDDPRTASDVIPTPHYYYRSDGSANTGNPVATTYIIYADLEKDGYGSGYWVLCSNGSVGFKNGSIPLGATCPI